MVIKSTTNENSKVIKRKYKTKYRRGKYNEKLSRKTLYGRIMKGIDMKKFTLVISLSFLVLLLLVSNVYSSDWVKYDYDDGTVYSYQIVNIDKGDGKYIVYVWEKIVYSDKGRKEEIQGLTQHGFTTKEVDKLSQYKNLMEIDCKRRREMILSIIISDTDGNLLYHLDYDDSKWRDIVPNSDGDTLQKKVCQ